MMLAAFPAIFDFAEIITSVPNKNVFIVALFIVYHNIAVPTHRTAIVLCCSCPILASIAILDLAVRPASIVREDVCIVTFIVPHV